MNASGAIHATGNAVLDTTSGVQGEFTLRAASLTRDPGTVVTFLTDPATGRKITFDTAPTLTGGILPYAGHVTYDAGADPLDPSHDIGIRALTAAELASSIPAAGSPGPARNVLLASSQTVTGNVVANSVAGAGVVLDNANLHVESGYLGSAVSGTGSITAPDAVVRNLGWPPLDECTCHGEIAGHSRNGVAKRSEHSYRAGRYR